MLKISALLNRRCYCIQPLKIDIFLHTTTTDLSFVHIRDLKQHIYIYQSHIVKEEILILRMPDAFIDFTQDWQNLLVFEISNCNNIRTVLVCEIPIIINK